MLDQVDVWFQDETRIGQQGSTTRMWAKTGTRPRVVRQQQFLYAYIYGAVCPATEDCVGLVMPYANGYGMQKHIEEIAKKIPKDRHAVLIVDGASWHSLDYNLSNLTLIKIPPYSPELNPIEQVWSWIKQTHLSNRCYESYDDILESACAAWNAFTNKKGFAKSICQRDWINMNG